MTCIPLAASLHLVSELRSSLSPRLAQTVIFVLEGQSEKEIASQLGVSPHTVHVYMKNLYRHFQVSTRTELMALLYKSLLSESAGVGFTE